MTKQIKINNKITGYRAYGKMGIAKGTIFNFVKIENGVIEFTEVGQPNRIFFLTMGLYPENTFEVIESEA